MSETLKNEILAHAGSETAAELAVELSSRAGRMVALARLDHELSLDNTREEAACLGARIRVVRMAGEICDRADLAEEAANLEKKLEETRRVIEGNNRSRGSMAFSAEQVNLPRLKPTQ